MFCGNVYDINHPTGNSFIFLKLILNETILLCGCTLLYSPIVYPSCGNLLFPQVR